MIEVGPPAKRVKPGPLTQLLLRHNVRRSRRGLRGT